MKIEGSLLRAAGLAFLAGMGVEILLLLMRSTVDPVLNSVLGSVLPAAPASSGGAA